MELYKDRAWLYEMYVTKRMNITDIAKVLDNKYGIKTTPQTIYNYCKKYELLRYRGKGRKMAKRSIDSPMQKKIQQLKNEQRKRMRQKHGR